MTDLTSREAEVILSETEHGRTCIDSRFEGEPNRDATIRELRIVRTLTRREVVREIEQDNRGAIGSISFGVRGRTPRLLPGFGGIA